MKHQISVLGCGWLGLPLAQHLLSKGFLIKGSTTSAPKLKYLASAGIVPFQLELSEELIRGNMEEFLEDSIILIINIPPKLKKNPEGNFVEKMKLLISKIAGSLVEKVIFISSTSVFEDKEEFPIYTETSPPNAISPAGIQLKQVEEMLLNSEAFSSNIIRFGGLIGGERHPINYLSGRKSISNPQAPVNLIHQNDCIFLIEKVMEHHQWGEVFHGSSPEHPSKKMYYTKIAKEKGMEIPEFDEEKVSKGKIIDSGMTQEKLRFSYSYKM